MSHWHFQPILNSYLVVALTAAALLLLLVVGPSFRRISPGQRAALGLLRLLVIGCLVVGLLRPARTSTTSRPQTATLLVLLDQSRSMQLPDAAPGRSRWQAQQESLLQSLPLLRALAKTYDVRVFPYDAQLHAPAFDGQNLTLPPAPPGDATDLGTSLHEALERELGQRLAAVILLGDGAQTAVAPRVEIQEAGRAVDRLGVPLYTVAFGPAGDQTQARDVAVDRLPDQYSVFVKNELTVQALLEVRGYVHQPIPVEMLVEKPDGQEETIGPQVLTAREDGQQLPIELRYVPQQTGRYKLTVRAAEQPGERVTKNNRLSAFLRVLEGGVKVLYLEGALRAEQKFLRRAWEASPDLEVDFQWIDHRQRERWPVDLSTALQDPQYDVFVLGDLDAAALGEANAKLLAAAVDRGKGLALLGGYHSFGAGRYYQTPLADVMPIVMDRLEGQDFDAPVRPDLHVPGPVTFLPVRSHPVLSLAPERENAAVWKQLPPLGGANKFVGVKDAAGVLVIGASEAGQPLAIVGQYGRGRVLALAVDSTWRWCMHGFEDAHKRFWRQVVLWLVRRDDREQNEVWVRLAQRRFFPGARVAFAAGAKNAAGEPIATARLTGRLIAPDASSQPLRLARDGEDWAGILEAVTQPGDYAVEITAEQDGRPLGTARGEFLVFDQDLELSRPAADHDQLARLAALTQDAGGRTVAAEQLPTLLQDLGDRPPAMEIQVQTRWQLADTAPDAWLFFLAVIGLLTAEWFLRKKWGLV